MNIKSFIILSLSFTLITSVYGQKPKSENLPKFDHRFMHFGFLIGINSANFSLERLPHNSPGADSLYTLDVNTATGFNLGIISSLHLSNFFSLRFTPNLAFSARTLDYKFQTVNDTSNYTKTIESTLINFPLGIKYKSVRLNNFSAYIMVGGAYSLDLASNVDNDNNATIPKDVIVAIKKHDFIGEIGFGTDFYLQYFKFGIELKMSYGIRDILDHDNTQFSAPIDNLRSKMFLISFTFEG